MNFMKRAMFIGRFQPFHNGHLKAVKDLIKKYDEVVIVIGSSLDSYTFENPFTCGERLEMIRGAFTKSELSKISTITVPDLNDNTSWVDHVLLHAPSIHSIYSNNQLVKFLFSRHGIIVKSTGNHKRDTNEGKKIRELMKGENPEWRKHVPKNVSKFIEEIEGEKRVKLIASKTLRV